MSNGGANTHLSQNEERTSPFGLVRLHARTRVRCERDAAADGKFIFCTLVPYSHSFGSIALRPVPLPVFPALFLSTLQNKINFPPIFPTHLPQQ